MKAIYTFLTGLILLNASCITVYRTPGKYEDDIYYSSKNKPAVINPEPQKEQATIQVDPNTSTARTSPRETTTPSSTTTDQYKDDKGNTYVTNNYYDNDPFNADDYYDYGYAARLRRFHNPYAGYGYYDGYYTNSYWYTHNPYHWGVSIYMGYNWWGPSYFTYSYNPVSYWYGCDNWGWGHPYGYYSGGYGGGYHHGYRDGYWDGYNDNYYHNNLDKNSYHYGPRKSIKSNGQVVEKRDFRQKYRESLALENRPANPNTMSSRKDPSSSIDKDLPSNNLRSASPINSDSKKPAAVGNERSKVTTSGSMTKSNETPPSTGKKIDPQQAIITPNGNNTKPENTSKSTSVKEAETKLSVPKNNIPQPDGNTTKAPVVPSTNVPRASSVVPNTDFKKEELNMPKGQDAPAPPSNTEYKYTPPAPKVEPQPAPSRPHYNENRASGNEGSGSRPRVNNERRESSSPPSGSGNGGGRSSGSSKPSGGNTPGKRR